MGEFWGEFVGESVGEFVRESVGNSVGDSAAVMLDPKFAIAFADRGAAKSSLGDHNGAVEDCTSVGQ